MEMNKSITVFGQASVLRLTNNGTVSKITVTFSEHENKDVLWSIFKDPRPIAIVPLTNETDIEEGLKKRDSDENFEDDINQSDKFLDVKNDELSEWAVEEDKSKTPNHFARNLYKSALFRNPIIWKLVGSDEEFLSFIRTQNCAHCKKESPSEAAHVRRISNGAGEGIKPAYSAIPLCHECHSNQHQHGESELGGKEWFDKMRIKYLHLWCWETVKKQIGKNSWREIDYIDVGNWIRDRKISQSVTTFHPSLQISKEDYCMFSRKLERLAGVHTSYFDGFLEVEVEEEEK